MAIFRFRAESALAFRRTREEAARLALAQAEGRAADAKARVEAAEAGLAADCRRFAADERHATRASDFQWHRAWIVASRQRLDRLRASAHAATAEQRTAAAAMHRARRDVRALERLRERAWRAFAAEETRREQIDLDWLGTLKHAMARREAKEEP